jgi:hypothetical protein
LYISKKAIDDLVTEGGKFSFQGWAYDIIVDRLEKNGFKKRSGIVCEGTDGAIYCNDSGYKVVVTTQRFAPFTMVRSIKPKN